MKRDKSSLSAADLQKATGLVRQDQWKAALKAARRVQRAFEKKLAQFQGRLLEPGSEALARYEALLAEYGAARHEAYTDHGFTEAPKEKIDTPAKLREKIDALCIQHEMAARVLSLTNGKPFDAASVARDVLAEADLARLALWCDDQQPARAETPIVSENAALPGVAARDQWFLQQYNALGTDTYHRPAAIHRKWENMKIEERAAICPNAPNKVSYDGVVQAIKRLKKGSKKAAKKVQRPRKGK